MGSIYLNGSPSPEGFGRIGKSVAIFRIGGGAGTRHKKANRTGTGHPSPSDTEVESVLNTL